VEISKVAERDAPHCAFCRAGIAVSEVTIRCQECHARVHPACRDELSLRCPTLGCQGLWSDQRIANATPAWRLHKRLLTAVALVALVGTLFGGFGLLVSDTTERRIRGGAATVNDVPYLLEQLRKTPRRDRPRWALTALVRLGPSAVPEVVRSAARPDAGRREVEIAVEVLAGMGPGAAPYLTEFLHTPDPNVRVLSALALAEIGPAGREAVPALEELLRTSDYGRVQEAAASALGAIGGPDATRALLAALHRGEPVAEPLKRIAVSPDEASLGLLIDALAEATPRAGATLLSTLSRVHHPRVVAALADALGSEDVQTAAHAAQALEEQGASASAAVPALAQALNRQDDVLRLAAARALAAMGPEARPALPHLQIALRAPSMELTRLAAQALAGLGEPGIQALARGLDDHQDHVREQARERLAALGEDAACALPILAAFVEHGPPPARLLALGLIAGLGPRCRGALPHVTTCLAEGYPREVRLAAIATLHALGANAIEAAPALRHLLDDSDQAVRQAAASTVERIELLEEFQRGIQAAREAREGQ